MKLLNLVVVSSIVFLLGASPGHAQCSDAYEPDNNAFGTATVIRDGDIQHHNFCDDPNDWVTFAACGGRVYTITTSNLGEQADTLLQLYSPDGITVLASNDDGNGGLASRIVWTAPVAGSYHVKVLQANNTHGLEREYDLQLTGSTSACDLWTGLAGGAQWDEADALVQRGDGSVLATGFTESYPVGPSPSLFAVVVGVDGASAGNLNSGLIGEEVAHAAARDRNGNIVILGEYCCFYGRDSLVVSYGIDGTSLRYKVIAGSDDDYSNAIAIIGTAAYVAAGSTRSGGAGGLDGWLYHVPVSLGDPDWARTIGGTADEEFYSVVANANGDITAAGYTKSFGAGQKDGFVARMNASGDLLWSRVIGGAGSDEFRKVFETPDGGLLLIGTTTGLSVVATTDIWLMELDGQGQPLWEKVIAGTGDDRVLGGVAVSDGYVLAGYSDSSVVGSYDGLLLKLNATGDLLWTRTYGGAGTDRLNAVIEAIDGSLVATGYMKSEGSLADAWILKTAADGTNGTSCSATASPSLTIQSRSSTVVDPSLTAAVMSVVYSGQFGLQTGSGGSFSLQCQLLAPTEVSGPNTLAPLLFVSRTDLVWEDSTVNNANSFNLYRGDITGLSLGDSGSCLGTIPTNAYTDPDEPGNGQGWFYVVTGRNALGEGPMGTNSTGQNRANVYPCP